MGITTINNQIAITIDPNKMKSKRVKRVNTIKTLITNSDKGITFLEPERYEELSGELALLEFIDELEHLLFAKQIDLSPSDRQLVEQEYRRFLVIDDDYQNDLNMLCYLTEREHPIPAVYQHVKQWQ